MRISFDPVKRAETLRTRGLDFADAAEVFDGPIFTFPDERVDYPEERYITAGLLSNRMVIVVWTPTGRAARHFDEESQWPRASALFTQTWPGWTPMKSSPRNTKISPN